MKNNILNIIGGFVLILSIHACTPPATPTPTPVIPVGTDTTMMDISYSTDPQNKMDVYLPAGRTTDSTKVIILIHGGAWSGGDKSEMTTLVSSIQAAWPQVAIININYRLANGTSIIHTQISADLVAAVDYITAQGAEWNISDDMGMIGASAGAHLALLYGYQLNTGGQVKVIANMFGPSYFADYEYYNSFNIFLGGNVKDIYKKYTGEFWNPTLYQSLSPYHLLTSSPTTYLPTITFHGTLDPIVPIYHSQWFKAKQIELGLDYEYYPYEGEFHGFSAAKNIDAMNKTVAFFKTRM